MKTMGSQGEEQTAMIARYSHHVDRYTHLSMPEAEDPHGNDEGDHAGDPDFEAQNALVQRRDVVLDRMMQSLVAYLENKLSLIPRGSPSTSGCWAYENQEEEA